MASISERESREIEAANGSGATPVVFIHGLWLLPSSWAKLGGVLQAGLPPLTPDSPDDPDAVEEARANPDVLAKKTLKQVADHTADVIGKLEQKPAVMGHSTGGLFAQMLAGRGLSAATVAIDPGVFRGVLWRRAHGFQVIHVPSRYSARFMSVEASPAASRSYQVDPLPEPSWPSATRQR